MKLLDVTLCLCEIQEVTLGDLQTQGQPFTLGLNDIHPLDMVQEFNGVIAQNGELITARDYVELVLPSDYQEVCTQVILSMCMYRLSVIAHCINTVKKLIDTQNS